MGKNDRQRRSNKPRQRQQPVDDASKPERNHWTTFRRRKPPIAQDQVARNWTHNVVSHREEIAATLPKEAEAATRSQESIEFPQVQQYLNSSSEWPVRSNVTPTNLQALEQRRRELFQNADTAENTRKFDAFPEIQPQWQGSPEQIKPMFEDMESMYSYKLKNGSTSNMDYLHKTWYDRNQSQNVVVMKAACNESNWIQISDVASQFPPIDQSSGSDQEPGQVESDADQIENLQRNAELAEAFQRNAEEWNRDCQKHQPYCSTNVRDFIYKANEALFRYDLPPVMNSNLNPNAVPFVPTNQYNYQATAEMYQETNYGSN